MVHLSVRAYSYSFTTIIFYLDLLFMPLIPGLGCAVVRLCVVLLLSSVRASLASIAPMTENLVPCVPRRRADVEPLRGTRIICMGMRV